MNLPQFNADRIALALVAVLALVAFFAAIKARADLAAAIGTQAIGRAATTSKGLDS